MGPEQTPIAEINYPDYPGIFEASQFTDRITIEATAWELINQREQFIKAEVGSQEYQDNARTALMEAMTASGHLSRIEIHGTLEEINHQVLSRLLAGWDENLPFPEKERRFQEVCEELTIQALHQKIVTGELPKSLAIGLISDFITRTDKQLATDLGYRYNNRKGMVRSTELIVHSGGGCTRVIEQVSRSNGTWISSCGFLASAGIRVSSELSPDVAVMAAPFVFSREDYANGIIDIQRRLDEHAGKGVLYGDRGERVKRHPAYENLRQESSRREQEIGCFVKDLARLEKQLNEMVISQQINADERSEIFKGEVERILDAICTLEPSYAEDTFGEQSAVIFQQAAVLHAQGRSLEAQFLLESHDYLKETVTFCGTSLSIDKAKELGLEVNSYNELVEKGKESWPWKQGVCVVKTCSTRPGKTEVGPCSVCRKCQIAFDRGDDPTKATPKSDVVVKVLFGGIPKPAKELKHAA